ncbi:hypothetical protein FN846DRAFT_985808 [Sphaerosporella brunnea]|uniref:Uncharacterized protein n=1 Tax=Sphaerosporella brunnea TaxID=1250544 RepID=A0A5J5ETQ5_9PEZI|nr:hypothetical protein FN846DRAFT_985808 [Sphaerosporella brunnea]
MSSTPPQTPRSHETGDRPVHGAAAAASSPKNRATPPHTRIEYPSVVALCNAIDNFLNATAIAEEDLAIKVSHDQFLSHEVTTTLSECTRQRRRFSYNPETQHLHIFGMARPLHDSLSTHMSRVVVKMAWDHWFTQDEILQFDTAVCQFVLPRSGYTGKTGSGNKKIPAWHKTPDVVAKYSDEQGDTYPLLVGEVGFSETYEDLVSDARQWLLKEPKVRLVILVKISEDSVARKQWQKARRDAIEDFIDRFCDAPARPKPCQKPKIVPPKPEQEPTATTGGKHQHGDDHGSESDAELYSEIGSALEVKDWVGPITVFMEFWRRDEAGQPVRQGERMQIMPAPPTDATPEFRITDFIRQPITDPNRTRRFDIPDYRNTVLPAAVRGLAKFRAIDACRSRVRNPPPPCRSLPQQPSLLPFARSIHAGLSRAKLLI